MKTSPMTVMNGGLAYFPGVALSGGKNIEKITVDPQNSTVTANYADGCVYSVSGEISQNGNVSEITDLSALWNDESAPLNDAFISMLLNVGGGSDAHPDKLTYTDSDPDYELPESITPLSDETFDTVTETWEAETEDDEEKNIVWGVGIKNKGTDNEIVTRLIYPDFTEMQIIGFDF